MLRCKWYHQTFKEGFSTEIHIIADIKALVDGGREREFVVLLEFSQTAAAKYSVQHGVSKSADVLSSNENVAKLQ